MKPPKPSKAPLISTPIEQPWEMIAVDVLLVPMSLQQVPLTEVLRLLDSLVDCACHV